MSSQPIRHDAEDPSSDAFERAEPPRSDWTRLAAHPIAASTAREWISTHTSYLADELRESAVLMVSELVTNAVIHGEAEIMLGILTSAGVVRVEVHDRGIPFPEQRMRAVAPEQTGGRGLFIVGVLATRWGVTPLPDRSGKSVWFELVSTSPTRISLGTQG